MKPEDRKGDFTFSRSTAATRVNASGNIEKETGNLLTYSNTFSSWSVLQITSTSGQSGYDGSNDAWLLTDTATSGDHRLYLANSHSGVNTLSVYAKAGTKSIVYVQSYISNSSIAYFDLSAGSVLSSATDIDSNITDVGNGWYRCSIAFNNTNTYVTIGIAESATRSYVGDGTGNIYIQDAQLEQGLVARDYQETTTAAVYGGITDNTPRLDYTDSSCPALLLEPQRTNGITQSEYSGNYSTQGLVSLTNNFATSPEGYNNAFRAIPTTSNVSHLFFRSGMGGAADTYTQSIFAKANGYNFCFIRFDLLTRYAFFDLQNGTTAYTDSGITSTITDMGNGWYRCTATMTTTNYANAVIGVAEAGDSLADRDFAGDGSSSVLFYGHQSELGSYATSYIPTYGSAVTRGKDDCTLSDVSNVIADSKGSFYIEGNLSTIDTSGVIALTAGANTEDLFYIFITTAGVLLCEWFDGGTLQARLQAPAGSISVGDSFKIAAAYQDNDFVAYWNGTQIGTDSSGTAPTPTLLRIGKYNVDNYTGGSYTNVMVFPTRLSNEELADLTTI
jgi:hypothetical protein